MKLYPNFNIANKRLKNALENQDLDTVVDIYRKQADHELNFGLTKNGFFLLTQAYIYALEINSPLTDDIRKVLILNGKETL